MTPGQTAKPASRRLQQPGTLRENDWHDSLTGGCLGRADDRVYVHNSALRIDSTSKCCWISSRWATRQSESLRVAAGKNSSAATIMLPGFNFGDDEMAALARRKAGLAQLCA